MPIARIRIGSDVFVSGDGVLLGGSVTLSEDARASSCSFSVYDKGLRLAGRYFRNSYETGGIEVPADLLSAPQPPAAASSVPVGGASGGGSTNGTLSPSMRAILDMIAYAEGADYNVMFGGGTFDGFADHPRQLVGGGGYTSDAAGRYQFLSTTWDTLELPDFSPENQDLGCVKLIERRDAIAEAEAGDIAGFCDKCSYEWASLPPSRYGQPQKTLEELTQIYQDALGKYGTGGATSMAAEPTPPAEPEVKDAAKPEADASTTEEEKKEDATPKESPTNDKGREIIVELGFRPDQLTAYHFIHVGTDASGRAPDTCSFSGKSIRWEMSRRSVNCTWTDVTLREVAEDVCERYRRRLDMEGDGPTYAHLDATGITYLELLFRECRAIGYRMFDDGNVLQLRPWRPGFVGFVITPEMQAKFSFSDKATGDKYAKPGEKTTPDQPETTAADTKLELDLATGETKQVNPEDSTGMGEAGDTTAVTGAGTPAMHGSTKPADGADAGGTVKAVAGAMGMDANPIPDNPLPVNSLLPESVTGLPSQQVGAIDLADGKATGEAIRDESRRVKSYESSATIVTSTEALRLAPGSVIAIAEACFDNEDARSAFAKEWRLSSVTHSLQSGKLETQLSFYTPQAQKPPQPPGGGGAASGSSMADVTLQPGELIWPMRIEGNSSANGSGTSCTEFGYDRGRLHDGIDFGGYGIQPDPDLVWASGQGRVIKSHYEDGYGNIVEIEHAGGYMTFYAHLASIDPAMAVGAEVQQGQKVGIRGDTGGPYVIHLHFGIHLNGEPVNPRDHISQPGIPIMTP